TRPLFMDSSSMHNHKESQHSLKPATASAPNQPQSDTDLQKSPSSIENIMQSFQNLLIEPTTITQSTIDMGLNENEAQPKVNIDQVQSRPNAPDTVQLDVDVRDM